jgi:hypothetical protein
MLVTRTATILPHRSDEKMSGVLANLGQCSWKKGGKRATDLISTNTAF